MAALTNGKPARLSLGVDAPAARNLFMRATGTVVLSAGEYRFRIAEKNAQLFLDGEKVSMKNWQHSKPWSDETHVSEGPHTVQVLLAHRTSTTVANRLVLETLKNPGCADGEWQVDFLSTPSWAKAGDGEWFASSCHPKLNKDAASLAPAGVPPASLRDGAFTVRATLKMNFAKGHYRLGVEDAGGKLAVDGVEVMGLSLASTRKSHLRFSRQVSLEGTHKLTYHWAAPHADSAMRAFWVAEPECQSDQWLVEFYRTQERSSWLQSECHIASRNHLNFDVPKKVQAAFTTLANDNSHLGYVWQANQDSVFVRVSGRPSLNAARHHFSVAGNDVLLRLDGTAVHGLIDHDGHFHSDSVEVKPGKHLVESHLRATAGTTVEFSLSGTPACKQGDFLVEWFPHGHSLAAASALYTACASESEVKQSLSSRNLKHVAEQGLALRLTGQVNFAEGLYRFKGSASGSVKAWVDGQSVIDFYASSNEEKWSASQQLGGLHQMRYEFRGSDAELSASASWERVPDCGNCGWLLEYFSKPVFAETNFVGQRCLQGSQVGHLDFKETMVPTGIVGDFGVRASTNCKLEDGSYNFDVPAAKEVRLIVDGASLVDGASEMTKTNTLLTKPYSLTSGDHRIVFEQRQGGGVAEGHLSWELAKPDFTAKK